MKKLKIIKILFIFSIFIFFIFSTRLLITAIKKADGIYIEFDPNFSEKSRLEIDKFIRDLCKNKIKSFWKLASLIKNNYPIIKTILIKQTNNKKIKIQITSHIPKLKINDNFIFTHNNILLPKEAFNPETTDYVDNIIVKERTNLIKDFLTDLKPELYQNFDIIWENKNKIILSDKNSKKIILIKYNKNFDKNIFKIYNSFFLNEGNEGGKGIIDLRFDNQIIIS